MRGLRPFHLVLALVLVSAVALVLRQGRRVRDDRADVLRALRAAQGPRLPAPASAGALTRTDPARYGRDTLYELVDGAAEGYLGRGFEACLASTYAFPGAPASLEVSAETYRFTSAEGARSQLEADRPSAVHDVPGLPAAVSDGAVLLAISGRDLLKLTSLTADARGGAALVALARAWTEETSP